MRATSLVGFLVVSLAGASARGQPPLSEVIATRIERVLVYSDQARVRRSATVELDAGQRAVPLVDLPATADRSSVRVSSPSAEVVRVEVVQSRGRLPRQVEA